MNSPGDLLAAVALHALLEAPLGKLDLQQMAQALNRDPTAVDDLRSIKGALDGLVNDGLARLDDNHYSATRAAIRARELAF